MTIPSKELIGQNAEVIDGIYSDDYLKALNEFAPVDDVFGAQKENVSLGGNAVAELIMGTLGVREYENHLVDIVMNAANSGEWRAVSRSNVQMQGLEAVTKKHFGYITEHEGRTLLLPSPHYVTYCEAQLNSLGGK